MMITGRASIREENMPELYVFQDVNIYLLMLTARVYSKEYYQSGQQNKDSFSSYM